MAVRAAPCPRPKVPFPRNLPFVPESAMSAVPGDPAPLTAASSRSLRSRTCCRVSHWLTMSSVEACWAHAVSTGWARAVSTGWARGDAWDAVLPWLGRGPRACCVDRTAGGAGAGACTRRYQRLAGHRLRF